MDFHPAPCRAPEWQLYSRKKNPGIIPGRVASVEVLPNVVGDVRDDQLRLGDIVGFEILEVLIVQFTFQLDFSP